MEWEGNAWRSSKSCLVCWLGIWERAFALHACTVHEDYDRQMLLEHPPKILSLLSTLI